MKRLRLILIRDHRDDLRIFGALLYGTRPVVQTLERRDLHAAPGDYELVPHGWGDDPHAAERTKKRCWALVGQDISHDPEPGKAHSAVLIHAGNRIQDSKMCTLAGLFRGMLEGEPAVLESARAMLKLRELLGPRYADLTIMEKFT